MKIPLLVLLFVLSGLHSFSQQDFLFADTVFYPVKHLDQLYFMDSSKVIYEDKPHYQSVDPIYFSGEVFYIVRKNGKYGVIRQNLA